MERELEQWQIDLLAKRAENVNKTLEQREEETDEL